MIWMGNWERTLPEAFRERSWGGRQGRVERSFLERSIVVS